MNKEEFLKKLEADGYSAKYDNSGIPTVLCKDAEDIQKTTSKIKKIAIKYGYEASFGIRPVRKEEVYTVSDIDGDSSEDTLDKESDENTTATDEQIIQESIKEKEPDTTVNTDITDENLQKEENGNEFIISMDDDQLLFQLLSN